MKGLWAMVKTVNLSADIPTGLADIVLAVSSSVRRSASTLGDLADSEFFGIWRDRPDIADSAQCAHDLRPEGWERSI